MLEAVHRIAPRVGGDRQAKRAIVERLRDCSIEARAWWIAQGADIGRPYVEPVLTIEYDESEPPPTSADFDRMRRFKSMPKISRAKIGDGLAWSVHRDVMLGGALWIGATKEDLRRWDWRSGFCIATFSPGARPSDRGSVEIGELMPTRLFALGVELKESDVLKIVGSHETAATAQTTRGRSPSSRTGDWVAELLLLNDSEGIAYLSANEVYERVANRLADRGVPELARSSAYPIIQTVLKRLRDKQDAER